MFGNIFGKLSNMFGMWFKPLQQDHLFAGNRGRYFSHFYVVLVFLLRQAELVK